MSKQRSFIATLSFNGQPLNGFAESTRGPVVLETPGTLPATAVAPPRRSMAARQWAIWTAAKATSPTARKWA